MDLENSTAIFRVVCAKRNPVTVLVWDRMDSSLRGAAFRMTRERGLPLGDEDCLACAQDVQVPRLRAPKNGALQPGSQVLSFGLLELVHK